MKKRIGTKFYDTDKSEYICESIYGKVYRKITGLGEYFACDGNTIIPLEYDLAKDLVKNNAPEIYGKLFTLRDKDTTKKIIAISISDFDKLKLRRASAQRKMSMSEYIVWLVDQDEKRLLK